MDLEIYVNNLLKTYGVIPNRKTPEETCNEVSPPLPPREFHLCVIDENLKIHEAYRQRALAETVARTNHVLELVEQAPPNFWQNPIDAVEHGFLSIFRHANSQTDNWLLLEAARKGVYLFYLTEEPANLQRSLRFLEVAKENRDTSLCFDTDPASWADLRSETIFPVEGYFEIKLTMLQIYNITDPGKAALLSREIEGELASSRIITAQRSNPISAQGYVNRLRLLQSNLALFETSPDLDKAINIARESQRWAEVESNRPMSYLLLYGLSRKDLRHDALQAQITTAKLLMRKEMGKAPADRDFSESIRIFQDVLAAPESTRKYGGFLDLGLESFSNLLYIAISSSASRNEAADKFNSYIDWNKINQLPDFKETLGLLVRRESYCSLFANATRETCPEPKEVIGNIFLYLGRPDLAPLDTKAVITEINLNDPSISDPETRLDIAIRCLQSSEVDKKLLGSILSWWLTAGH
ncbi:MAG: hypothetical protein ABIH56_06345 [Candidatus Margulisiibacteriota bacterium]